MHAEGFTVGAMRTRWAELSTVVADLRDLLDNPPDLASVPVTVISGGGGTPGMTASVREAVNAAHRATAERATKGRHVVAHRSGHMVPMTEPGLIADEIRRLLPAL